MNGNIDLSLLRTLTENPEFMQKAMSMASALSASGIFSQMTEGQSQTNDRQEPPNLFSSPGGASPAAGGFSPAAGGMGDALSLLAGAMGGSSQSPSQNKETGGEKKDEKAGHKDRIRLLEAMRPFVPPERRDKLDFIIKLLGLMQIANQLGLKNILEGR